AATTSSSHSTSSRQATHWFAYCPTRPSGAPHFTQIGWDLSAAALIIVGASGYTLSSSTRPEGNGAPPQPPKVWRLCAPLPPAIAPESGHASCERLFLAPLDSSSAHWRLLGKKPLPSRARNLGASRKRAPFLLIPAHRVVAQASLQLAWRPIAPRKVSRLSILRAPQAGNLSQRNRHPETPTGSRHPV